MSNNDAYVDEGQVPPPHRLPDVMAELNIMIERDQCTIYVKTHLIAAVSSVTPSPFAPKSLTLRKT